MALSKQRKVYVGLLALALGALGVDQLLGGGAVPGPQTAEAADLLIAPGDRASVPVDNRDFVEAVKADGEARAQAASTLALHTLVSVASQMDTWAASRAQLSTHGASNAGHSNPALTSQRADAFALPSALVAIIAPAASTTADAAGAAKSATAATPNTPAFRLSAILHSGHDASARTPGTAATAPDIRAVAIINDTPCRVGSKVDGWTLTKVEERHVVLTGPNGETTTLKLPDAQDLVKQRLPAND